MAEASSSIQNQSVIVSDGKHAVDAIAFRKALIAWGQKNFRVFAWRSTSDPYQVLMAEVMLHRTNALQVVPVYERFLRRYPDLPALAEATEEDLQEMLYSLGLRWRVRLIHEMVADLMQRFNGRIPSEKAHLLSLPGISDYIASAVCCFAWKQPQALIDTNTVRIVARVFNTKITDSLRRNRHFKELLEALVDPAQPASYNYALLDLANKVCFKVQKPDCFRCPLLEYCKHSSIASASATQS
jgi:A/G-specific adenine glycosylase